MNSSDGNNEAGDGCDELCQVEECGNGIVQVGEICDDGNQIDIDECLNQCQQAECGDAVVWEGMESCDDGGESALCNVDCTLSICGDLRYIKKRLGQDAEHSFIQPEVRQQNKRLVYRVVIAQFDTQTEALDYAENIEGRGVRSIVKSAEYWGQTYVQPTKKTQKKESRDLSKAFNYYYLSKFRIELKSIRLKPQKRNGKSWGVAVPMDSESDLPDIFIEIKQGSTSLLKTQVVKNRLSVIYSGESVRIPSGSYVIILVWDKDIAKSDQVGSVTVGHKLGNMILSSSVIESLEIEMSQ